MAYRKRYSKIRRRYTAKRKRVAARRPAVRRRRKARGRRVARRTYNTGKGIYMFSKDLRSYVDPFHPNQNPRIPDGSVQFSTGISHQCAAQLTQATTEPMTIVLFPGLERGLNWVGTDATPDAPVASVTWSDHANYAPTLPDGVATEGGRKIWTLDKPINKWRCVSTGLTMKMVNSSEDNSGWFEAVRVAMPAEHDHFNELTGLGLLDFDVFPYCQTTGSEFNSMVDNPSYVTDSLKNLYKHKFILAPNSTDHKFRSCEKRIEGTNGVAFPVDPPVELKRSLLDDSYDALVIRIHGTTGSTSESATRIQLHSVHNHEYVYDLESEQYKLQTAGDYVSNDSLRMTARKKNLQLRKASIAAATVYLQNRRAINSRIGKYF